MNNSIPLTVDYIPVKEACQYIMFKPVRIEDLSPTQRKVSRYPCKESVFSIVIA